MLAHENQRVTLSEFLDMSFDDHFTRELIDGVVCMSPRPTTFHQRIMNRLSLEIGSYLSGKSGHRCEGVTEAEMILGDDLVVPDYFVYCDPANMGEQHYTGTATLVIEILSKSTAFRDLSTKLNKYRAYGVKEYWVVSQYLKTVVVYDFHSDESEVHIGEYGENEVIKSSVFDDLSIDLARIFRV